MSKERKWKRGRGGSKKKKEKDGVRKRKDEERKAGKWKSK